MTLIKKKGTFCITINHNFGFKTKYDGLIGIKVKKGEKIARNDVIGKASEKIFYSIRIATRDVNPLLLSKFNI